MKQPDSLDVGTKMDVVRHRLNVAREDLDTAHLTFKAGKYRAANNRAYYSIFHTICAVLAKEGVAFKRHKDTLSYFNKNYVQPEIFPRELGRKIVKAEEIRHAILIFHSVYSRQCFRKYICKLPHACQELMSSLHSPKIQNDKKNRKKKTQSGRITNSLYRQSIQNKGNHKNNHEEPSRQNASSPLLYVLHPQLHLPHLNPRSDTQFRILS